MRRAHRLGAARQEAEPLGREEGEQETSRGRDGEAKLRARVVNQITLQLAGGLPGGRLEDGGTGDELGGRDRSRGRKSGWRGHKMKSEANGAAQKRKEQADGKRSARWAVTPWTRPES